MPCHHYLAAVRTAATAGAWACIEGDHYTLGVITVAAGADIVSAGAEDSTADEVRMMTLWN